MIPRVLVNGLLQADWFEPIAVHVNGLPFTSEGSLAVAIDATVDHVHNGIPFDADGRVCVEEGSAAYHLAGRAYTASNRLLVDIFGTQASALAGLPLTSAGALAVEMFASATFALDFARDQYSTLSPALTVSSPTGGVMVPDYLGNYHKTLAGEIPIRGGRRKRQEFVATEDFTDASWQLYNGAAKVGETTVAGVTVTEISFGSTGGPIGSGSACYAEGGSITPGDIRRAAFWVRAKSGSTTVRVSISAGTDAGTDDVTVSDQEWTRIAFSSVATSTGPGNVALRNNVAGDSGNVYVALATSYIGSHQDALPDVYTSDTIEEPEYVSRGVLSSPYHGYGVDGLAWMRTDPEGNSLADAASGYPVLCTGIADWPQITNLAWPSESFAGQAITVTNGQPYTISFRGTGSIAYSGAASGTLAGTGADDLVSVTVTTTTTTLTLASPTGTVTEVQVTAGSAVQPHVPTTSSAVTADAIVKTLDDSLIGWVAGGGTMIVEQTPEQDASTGDILIDIKTDADNRILVSGAGGNTQLLVRDGASDVATINGTGWQAGVTQRVAAKVEANDAELVIDGASEGTDTSLTVPAITTITLGGGQAKSIGAIAYYAAGA